MKRAIIIIPPLCDFYFTPHRWSTIGVGITAELLKNEGVAVDVLNLTTLKRSTEALPKSLHYLSDYLQKNETGKTSFFSHYYRFGPSTKECVDLIRM